MKSSSIKIIGIIVILFVPLIGVGFMGVSQMQITPNDLFFTNYIETPPDLDTATWALVVEGLVDSRHVYNWSEFTSLPSVEILATLQCVEGFSGTAIWKGVPVKTILEAAGVQAGAMDVIFFAADGYDSSLPLTETLPTDVILAYEMNGEPLPVEQGFPVRLVAPRHFGYKWVMWIIRIEIVDFDHQGYWEIRGWSDAAQRTPVTHWFTHALLFSITFILGGISLITGFKFQREPSLFKELPRFFTPKFHRFIAVTYTVALVATFSYWATQSFLLRGDLFFTVHGILSLIVIGMHLSGAALGQRRSMEIPHRRRWHRWLNEGSFYLLLGIIILGFLLSFGVRWVLR